MFRPALVAGEKAVFVQLGRRAPASSSDIWQLPTTMIYLDRNSAAGDYFTVPEVNLTEFLGGRLQCCRIDPRDKSAQTMPKPSKSKELLKLLVPPTVFYGKELLTRGAHKPGVLYTTFAKELWRVNQNRKSRHLLNKENVDKEWNRMIDTFVPTYSDISHKLKEHTSSLEAAKMWEQRRAQSTASPIDAAAHRGLNLVSLSSTTGKLIRLDSYATFKRKLEKANEGKDLAKADFELALQASIQQASFQRTHFKQQVEKLVAEEKQYWKGRQ